MSKRIFIIALAAVLLTGCSFPGDSGMKQYNATFLDVFDTVTTVVGRAESEEAFQATAQDVHDALLVYHRLFDIYNDYEELNNLKTVNDNAGIAPVEVDSIIIDLLLSCRDYYELTGGKVNVALGSVLRLWHNAREDGTSLPAHSALEEAATHCAWDTVIIDEEASTVYIADPDQLLDVGAIAKGWAAQLVAESAPAGLLISVGGNVCATGPKTEDGAAWVVGVNDPDGGDYLHTLNITGGSVVTSGDYQRYYVVDGKVYHHIIDPVTLYPSEYWRSVTIICADSGLADALSTALFLLPREEGLSLLEKCGAEAMWVDGDGNFYYSPGFESYIRT